LTGLAPTSVSRRRRRATQARLAGKARIAGRWAELAFLAARNLVGFARYQQAAGAGEGERQRQQQRRPQK
jgi:hypothetical protein